MVFYAIFSSFLCLIPFIYQIKFKIYYQGAKWVLIYLSYSIIMELFGFLNYFLKLNIVPENSIYQSISLEIPLLYFMYYSWSKDIVVVALGLINVIYWIYCTLFKIDVNLTLGGSLIIELITESYLLVKNRDWLLNWQFFIILAFIFYNTIGIFNFGFVDLLIQHNLSLGKFLQGFSNIGLYSIITLGLMQCKKQLSVQ